MVQGARRKSPSPEGEEKEGLTPPASAAELARLPNRAGDLAMTTPKPFAVAWHAAQVGKVLEQVRAYP